MSDSLFGSPLPEMQPSPEPEAPTATAWYRRRTTKVAAAGVAAGALVVGGFGVYAAASAPLDPAKAAGEALHNLGEGPVQVTVTSADEKDASITFTHTDAGTQVSMASPDGTVEAVLKTAEQRLYLRVDTDELTKAAKDPFVGMLAGFSSVDALLKGQWVSLDVSKDSKALSALTESAPAASDKDSKALTKASDELQTAVASIVTNLEEPVVSAITDNATVTRVGADAPSDGSEHYRVDLDVAGVQAGIAAELRGAADDLLSAVDTFTSAAGDDLPGLTEALPELRKDLTSALDEGLADDTQTETVDLYVADAHLTKIVTDGVTATFAADPALDEVSSAVSMDDDLVRLLPMVAGLMALGDQAG